MKHKDKVLHFAACFLAAFVSPYLSIGLAVGKEYGDYKANGNHWCWWDILADVLGIVLAMSLKLIINI